MGTPVKRWHIVACLLGQTDAYATCAFGCNAYTLVIKSVAASAYLVRVRGFRSTVTATAPSRSAQHLLVPVRHIYIYIRLRSAGRPRDLVSWPSWTRSVGSAIRREHVQRWGSCARRSLRHEANGGGCCLWRSWCFALTSYWWYFGWRWPASRRSISTPCARSMK